MAISVYDTFTDSDKNLDLHAPTTGTSWASGIAGGGFCGIVSNAFKYGTGLDMGAYKCAPDPASADCYIKMDLTGIPNGATSVGGGLRGTGSYGSFTGYCLILKAAVIYVGRHSNGSRYGDYSAASTKIITVSRAPIVGTYELRAVGSDIELYENSILIGSAVDATYSAIGFSSIYALANGTGILDNFESGDYVAVLPPSDPTNLTATCAAPTGEPVLADAPIASFTASTTSGTSPLTVNFTDTSANTPTSWLWDFGDSTTSTSQDPSHTFTNPSTSVSVSYPVRLTATNAHGSRTWETTILVLSSTQPVVPSVTVPPQVIFPVGIPGMYVQARYNRVGYYKVDRANHKIVLYSDAGVQIGEFGGLGTAAGKFIDPTSVSVVHGRQLIDRIESEIDIIRREG